MPAHGVVVSHLLRMRKALGSIPSVSIFKSQFQFASASRIYILDRRLREWATSELELASSFHSPPCEPPLHDVSALPQNCVVRAAQSSGARNLIVQNSIMHSAFPIRSNSFECMWHIWQNRSRF